MRISTIAAVANNHVIGKDNDLVWTLPKDMRFFMETTAGHVVITGRRNYESIPSKYRPLKGRTNVVITRNRDYKAEGAIVVHDLRDALDKAHALGETDASSLAEVRFTSKPCWATWWTPNTSPTWMPLQKGCIYPEQLGTVGK